jgi:hypothetical protein
MEFSNHYTKGKFIKDNVYSPTAVSKQCGAAILLRRLTETQAAPVEIVDRQSLILQLGETVTFAPTRVVEKARELQKMMNLAGAHLLEDGGKQEQILQMLIKDSLVNFCRVIHEEHNVIPCCEILSAHHHPVLIFRSAYLHQLPGHHLPEL